MTIKNGPALSQLLVLLVGVAWSIAFFALYIPSILLSAVSTHLAAKSIVPWTGPIVHGVVWIAGVLLVTWLLRVLINRRSWSGMALPRPEYGRLLLGALVGCLVMLLAGFIELQAGWLRISQIDFSPHLGTPKLTWTLLELFPALGVGVTEELAFRGYIFQTLAERSRVWIAAVLMAVIFAGFHFTLDGFGLGFVLSVIILSLMYVVLRFATGSLWFGIGLHGAWDWTQTYVVGLSTAGATGYNPAIVQIQQTGPAFWVGSGDAIESGLLFILLSALIFGLALVYAARVHRLPSWNVRLSPDGTPVALDAEIPLATHGDGVSF
jgi:uncharacterized protein